MKDAYPRRTQPGSLVDVVIRLLGAGAAAPTVEMGPRGEPPSGGSSGVTSARSGVGTYSLDFGTEKPGKLVSWHWGYGNTTGAVGTGVPKNVVIDTDSMDGTDNVLNYQICATDTGVAAELATTDKLCLTLTFKQSGTGV